MSWAGAVSYLPQTCLSSVRSYLRPEAWDQVTCCRALTHARCNNQIFPLRSGHVTCLAVKHLGSVAIVSTTIFLISLQLATGIISYVLSESLSIVLHFSDYIDLLKRLNIFLFSNLGFCAVNYQVRETWFFGIVPVPNSILKHLRRHALTWLCKRCRAGSDTLVNTGICKWPCATQSRAVSNSPAPSLASVPSRLFSQTLRTNQFCDNWTVNTPCDWYCRLLGCWSSCCQRGREDNQPADLVNKSATVILNNELLMSWLCWLLGDWPTSVHTKHSEWPFSIWLSFFQIKMCYFFVATPLCSSGHWDIITSMNECIQAPSVLRAGSACLRGSPLHNIHDWRQ